MKLFLFNFILFDFLLLCRASLWFLSQMNVAAVGTHGNSGMSRNSPEMICSFIPGLSKRQQHLCLNNPELMQPLRDGAEVGMKECQFQFQFNRWNCTTKDRSVNTLGTVVMTIRSREAAFVHAVLSAGVVHKIAQECQIGNLPRCKCDSKRRGYGSDAQGEFEWQGCSTNIRYAMKFARRFIDATDRRNRDPTALMDLHNNRAGRKSVRRNLAKQCKCHGLSGACSVRTCWTVVGKFHKVGNFLKRRFNRAVQVSTGHDSRALIPHSVALHQRRRDYVNGKQVERRDQPIRKIDLVYLDPSPDYCVEDRTTGSVGTAGRLCDPNIRRGSKNCEVMCCGRGYDTHVYNFTEQCKCEFVWCCEVKCETCVRTLELHTCKGAGGRASIALDPLSLQTHLNEIREKERQELAALQQKATAMQNAHRNGGNVQGQSDPASRYSQSHGKLRGSYGAYRQG